MPMMLARRWRSKVCYSNMKYSSSLLSSKSSSSADCCPHHQSKSLDKKSSSYGFVVLCYILFGALHELAHYCVAKFAFNIQSPQDDVTTTKDLLFSALLERNIQLNIEKDSLSLESQMIRHTGWIFSLLLLLFVRRKGSNSDSTVRYVALLTFIEAIWTDLLQLPVLLPTLGVQQATTTAAATTTFFCGNFGVILLHHMWLSDRSQNALDCLQKMVEVTMMRGAQSGGVVTFFPTKKHGDCIGTRSRVVNKKRTDLSVLVRKKVEQGLPAENHVPKDYVTCILGHTRFATSSKATLDGTHPHRWTPPTYCKVYDEKAFLAGSAVEARDILVENYITHNGDFDFYTLNGKTYDLEAVQQWLVDVTGSPMPASVDSCAIAGMIDIIRTKGCLALSLRYSIAFCLPTSAIQLFPIGYSFPTLKEIEVLAQVFDDTMHEILSDSSNTMTSINDIGSTSENRTIFGSKVLAQLDKLHRANMVLSRVDAANDHKSILAPFEFFIGDGSDPEDGHTKLHTLVCETINAFFDNDLFQSTRIFLKNAKGSFGLMTTSSLDAHRQMCLASRGQTNAVAFYPKKGLICYGSEQAAVKAGLDAELPGADAAGIGTSRHDLDIDALRLDLDDLGGEIIVLDWAHGNQKKTPAVTAPNRHLTEYKLMNGAVTAILYQESKSTTQDPELYHRMTRLTRNRFIKALQEEPADHDLVKKDIQDIPRICQEIQDDWHSRRAATSLNRLTAYNLSRCLRKRLDAHVEGTVPPLAVDILVTGCEVSLWVGEQFTADLRKAFPMLRIQAVSSNKLLGLYGQEIAVPSIGFQYSDMTYDIKDSIVIIVSHSGGTFAPLACSNLLQSATRNIFVVTSEWDTQIGKQLRAMDEATQDDSTQESLFNSRIFSTDVGIRPAEPCSVSVAATHQLLTNLFEYISVVILSDDSFRRVTRATITEQDLRTLERCNRMNIDALSEIVGFTASQYPFDELPRSCRELKEAGDLWAEHILENAKAYIMTFIYVFVTVTSGYPLLYAIAFGCGLDPSSDWNYLIRFFDSMIYFWMPQINVIILRLWQGRNLRHRMVARTVAIGDIPWVAQSAEAFLSKLFACSYSIAGVNVLSGNPVDHFVHRHTHRVTRGTLLVCGRPDGRLSKLSTAEASVCLSVNQASSIQSWGGTCESITIGHNPFKLPLSYRGIFLKRKRPMFLCERMLIESDAKDEKERSASDLSRSSVGDLGAPEDIGCNVFQCFIDLVTGCISCMCTLFINLCCGWCRRERNRNMDSSFFRGADCSIKVEENRFRSAAALFGAYMNMQEAGTNNKKSEVQNLQEGEEVTVDEIVAEAVQERKWEEKTRKLFQAIDTEGCGNLSVKEFVKGASKLNESLTEEEATNFFYRAANKNTGTMTYKQFVTLMRSPDFTGKLKAPASHKNDRGIIQIEASDERYFGATMRKLNRAGNMGVKDDMDFLLAKTQRFSQELYETRIASLQRFAAMTVMFHQMAFRVENFFSKISFGLIGYRMDRTQSIMRIASTASPVSGADVRHRMKHIRLAHKVRQSINVISAAYLAYREMKKNGKSGNNADDDTPSTITPSENGDTLSVHSEVDAA